jgi:hypothetical protein
VRAGFVVIDDRLPVVHPSWGSWRRSRRDRAGAARRRVPGSGSGRDEFCAMCWGAGRILRGAGNGEGVVAVDCSWCGGTGRVPA